MATIANLVVQIRAKSSGLARNLKGAKNAVGKFAKESIATLAKIGAAIGAAFAASGAIIISTINDTARSIDNLAKTSARLGIAIESLQGLRFAASLAGIETAKFDKIIQKMLRSIGELNQGTGESVEAFKELGISSKDIIDLSPDKQFELILNSLEKVGKQADKINLGQDILGRGGAQALNLTNGALEEGTKLFKELGLEITATQAKAVESFNDSKTALNAIFEGFKEQVTATVAPAFDVVVQHVIETIKEMEGLRQAAFKFGKAIIDASIAGIAAVQFIRNVFEGLGITLDTVVIGINILVIGFIKVQNVAESFFRSVATRLGQLGSALSLPNLGNLTAALILAGKDVDDLGNKFDGAEEKLQGLRDALASRIEAFESDSPVIQNLEKLRESLSVTQAAAARQIETGLATGEKPAVSRRTVTLADVQRFTRGGAQGPEVNIRVDAKTRELFNFVVENPEFSERINDRVDSRTEDARRRITR